jgi:hypothetical protein
LRENLAHDRDDRSARPRGSLPARIKREVWAAEAEALTREIAQRLPKDPDAAEAKKYAAQYREAAAEFEQEKETFGGVWGILKSLMLIQPTLPEQRVRDQKRQRLQRPAV